MRVVFPMPSDRELAYMDLCGWAPAKDPDGNLLLRVLCLRKPTCYHELRLPLTAAIGDPLVIDTDMSSECSVDLAPLTLLIGNSAQAMMIHLLLDIRTLLTHMNKEAS